MVDRLAKNDITKHEIVFGINYIHALNMLSYWKHVEENKKE